MSLPDERQCGSILNQRSKRAGWPDIRGWLHREAKGQCWCRKLLQKSPFCHSRRDSERESGSKHLKNHIRPRMLLSGIEEFGDDKQFCKSLILLCKPSV